MNESRVANASRNIIFSTILKAYQILLPFVIRTVMIYFMGMEYVGLNSLFTSVLQALNLAELGVGSAMVFSMYKPVAKGDNVTICALMKLYRLYYRIIGFVILVIGLIILPFIPKLIKGTVPGDVNVYVLYLLNLGTTVFSYWLFAYKNSLLNAYQRNDVISKLQIVTSTIQYSLQILALVLFKNYYVFLIVALLTLILNNILTAVLASKMYPDAQPKGELDKAVVAQINKRVKDLFTSKVGSVVVNSADSIVISAVLGLTSLALYQNYYYIISAVIGFSTVIYKAVIASIGNSIVTENIDKNFEDFKTISMFCFIVFGICTSCFLCLFQPFMLIWIGSERMLDIIMVVLFSLYFFVYELMSLFSLYKDGAGIWHQDRFRPLIEAACNLGLNLILVHFIGLYGILISTIVSMVFVSLPWLYKNLFKYVFERSSKGYSKTIFSAFALTAVISLVDYLICMAIPDNGILMFVLKVIVCVVVSCVLHLVGFRCFKQFNPILDLIDKSTGGRFNRFIRVLKKDNKEVN